jgi:lipid-binding SYLF domain-containing protein
MRLKAALYMMVFIYFIFLLLSSMSEARTHEIKKVEEATEVLTEIMNVPEQGIPESLVKDIYGIAVIPGLIKAGFIIGARHGQGVVSIREGRTWSNPSFITLTGGSIGWQIGAQSIDIILVFKSKKSIDGLMKGKFTLGADASVAAGPVGRQAGAGTDAQLKAEIFSYSRSRGLFAGLALEGSTLQIDDNANSAFYSTSYISPYKIFYKRIKNVPYTATLFKNALELYTRP